MRAFSVGIVGAGWISQNVHVPVLLALPEVRVAWVTDSLADRARGLARAFGLRDAPAGATAELPSCDVALLAIPLGARERYLEVFAERGTAVLVEKPFARTVEEHRRLLRTFPAHHLACGLMRRTYDSTLLLRKILREGWFGRLEGIRIAEGGRVARTGVDNSFFDDPAVSRGGILLELGCHGIDLAYHITGARNHRILKQRMIFDGRVDRKVEATIELTNSPPEDAVRLEIHYSWLDRQDNQVELLFPSCRVIAGTKPDSSVAVLARAPGSEPVGLLKPGKGAVTSYQSFFLEWRHFLQGLERGEPSLLSADSVLPVTALIEQLYQLGRVA